MGSSSLLTMSPSSDQKVWSALRTRVESLLDGRKRPADRSSSSPFEEDSERRKRIKEDSERRKRIKEDSLLFIRGLDSVASSLYHLKETLNDISQLGQGLANSVQTSITDVMRVERTETNEEKITNSADSTENRTNAKAEEEEICVETTKGGALRKAKDLAMFVVYKANSLVKELKVAESKLVLLEERCEMLEEENIRLKTGFGRGPTEDEEDLVRLQVEALLKEKSKLANENATLTRENQRLQQLVDYHQMNAQDLAQTYDDFIHGVRLDFSDLEEEEEEEKEEEES